MGFWGGGGGEGGGGGGGGGGAGGGRPPPQLRMGTGRPSCTLALSSTRPNRASSLELVARGQMSAIGSGIRPVSGDSNQSVFNEGQNDAWPRPQGHAGSARTPQEAAAAAAAHKGP
jgi:hypothetical protein